MTANPISAIGAKLPILFTYREALFGNDFLVEVNAVNGRALSVHEDGGVWMYGVNPGAMAAFGADEETARSEFRQMFSAILKDLAIESNSLDEFRYKVISFFSDTNIGHEQEWADAVKAVRNHEVDARDIPKAPAESPRSVTVEMKQIFRAEDNEAHLAPALAA